MASAAVSSGGGSVVIVGSFYIVALIACVGSVFGSLFCYAVLSVLSSFTIGREREREREREMAGFV